MERLRGCLPVMELLDAMKDIHVTLPDTDIWLRNYLKSLIKRLIENPSVPIEFSDSPSLGYRTSIASVLVETTIELCREKVLASQSQRSPPVMITVREYLHEAQSRGVEHLEPKLVLDQDQEKDQNAKEKGKEEEKSQGLKNMGKALPPHPVDGTR
ncbi:hypothetical protein F4814DRAFT_428985 [Daldinia grandis]|nr:hypothetical protein F4814DRAFT_428985 [Daldinia grandis]